jgi:glycine oxidase
MAVTQSDVLIIGGGVIGLSTAFELAGRGCRVTVIDRQTTGTEASWAGAGMLPSGRRLDAESPELRLRSYSHALWPDWLRELSDLTGINSGYRSCGALQLFEGNQRQSKEEHCLIWTYEGVRFEVLDPHQSRSKVPDLDAAFQETVFLPDFCQIRNPWHVRALRQGCLQRGVTIQENQPGIRLEGHQDEVSVTTRDGRNYPARSICITAGAWSAELLNQIGLQLPLKPIRGQIVLLQTEVPGFDCVIELGRRYLVPRGDGRILVGSTEEDVGFVKENTQEGVQGLLRFAESLVRSLGGAKVEKTWAGLRPCLTDEIPAIGQVPEFTNLFVGTGHFRSGLQMSPGTAMILADLITNQTPAISLDGLTPERCFVH